MDEIVRAFNYVIEKGWVRALKSTQQMHRILNALIRLCIGLLRSGALGKSKKHTVS